RGSVWGWGPRASASDPPQQFPDAPPPQKLPPPPENPPPDEKPPPPPPQPPPQPEPSPPPIPRRPTTLTTPKKIITMKPMIPAMMAIASDPMKSHAAAPTRPAPTVAP